MKKRIIQIAAVLTLLAALGIRAYGNYQARFVEINQVRYEKIREELDLSGQVMPDLELLKEFTGLKKLDVRGTGISIPVYETLKTMFPQAEILWDIPFQGTYYPMDTDALDVTALTDEDLADLGYFTELKTVSGVNCPDYAVLHTLRTTRTDLEVIYTVPAAGTRYDYDVKELELPGMEAAALMEVLPYFTELEAVTLTLPLAPAEEVLALREAFPEVAFSWQLELAGMIVDECTETLDLTGIPMTVEEMDAVLPYLVSLTYVDMTDCGIENEEMDALNRRYENVKIVWTVTLPRGFRIRTDATHFMPVNYNYYPRDNDLDNLRYCTDMIAIDVGHRRITNIDFVAYMPHLQFLLMCETAVRDLTPLTGLTELIYLELFMNSFEDLSPLVTLTALQDLNLHYVTGDPEIIAQMTWLKNLWWNHLSEKKLTAEQQQMLRDAIPECNFNFTAPGSTEGGWRKLPNYYAQRDIFGVEYMN